LEIRVNSKNATSARKRNFFNKVSGVIAVLESYIAVILKIVDAEKEQKCLDKN
jgi:hypothetical protein